MNTGWVKMHRKFLEWEWYDDINTKVLFLHCLLKANHKDKKWRGNLIKRGSFITSLSHLSDETGLSIQNVRTSFDKLESTGEVNKESTSVNTCVTIVNYDDYQSTNTGVTSDQQTSNKRLTTTKNEKNVENEKNDYVQFIDFWNEVNGCNLRITDTKRTQIKARLNTYTEEELKQSITNRSKDDWINGEGKKYKTNWDSFWRNDEKPERYLKERKQEPKPSYYKEL